jgi:pantoate--beta-alanine ligase
VRTETTIAGLRAHLKSVRSRAQTVALVPTMGYLHEGHLTLVDRASKRADHVVVSLFVNPLQFGPAEDLATYPRDLSRDSTLTEARGAHTLFAPSVKEMYPKMPEIVITAPALSDRLCGHFRPGHFSGVLTVVAKLFNIVQPDIAVFGQKDFQQSVLIRRMVSDLNLTVEIDVAPIVREPDGLALSSRNIYLSAEQRTAAVALSSALRWSAAQFAQGERSAAALLTAARSLLDGETGVTVQYLELVAPDTLDSVETAKPGDVLAVAAFVGKTRLIDNVVLGA